MLPLRKILFYVFALFYLVFCPILILYALGYIVSPGTEGPIVKSGLIYLSTTPPGATVYLGKRRYFKKTPAVISDLIPNNYDVKVVLKKYKPWNRTVPVEAGKATVLERILLFPDQWKQEKLISETFRNIIPISGSRYFILAKSDKAEDLFLYDQKSDEFQKLFPFYSPFGKSRVMRYFFVEKSTAFILQLDTEFGEKFLWIIPRRNEIRIKELTELFSAKPEHIEWDPSERKNLFSLQDGYLDVVNIKSKETNPKLISGIRGFGLHSKKIYVLKDNFTVERLNSKGEKEKNLFDDAALGQKLFNKEFYQIKIFSENIVVFLSEDGKLIVNRFPYQFLEEGLMGLQFDSKLDRLLIWTKHAIGILDLSNEKTDETQSSDSNAKLIWIYKQGQKIEQAFWVFNGSHILFRDRNKVFLMELETFGKPHLQELLEVKEKSSLYYQEDSGNLYYLEKTTGHLSVLELLRKEILTLPFPERKVERKKIEIGTL